MANLEQQFDAAMMDIYRRARTEAKYPATRYHQMLCEYGGVETARILINSDAVSDGYTALWERGRLDLTVEAMVFDHSDFHALFSEEEMNRVRERLRAYQYAPAM